MAHCSCVPALGDLSDFPSTIQHIYIAITVPLQGCTSCHKVTPCVKLVGFLVGKEEEKDEAAMKMTRRMTGSGGKGNGMRGGVHVGRDKGGGRGVGDEEEDVMAVVAARTMMMGWWW